MDLFQNNSDQKKFPLKDKLKNVKMEKGNLVLKYSTKFTQFHDEIGSVRIIVFVDDLVSLAILGLPKSWNSYQDSVNGR